MAGLLGQLHLFGFSYQKSCRQTGFLSVSCLLPTPLGIPLALVFKTYPENCLFSCMSSTAVAGPGRRHFSLGL